MGDTLADGAGATIYGTVLRDAGIYRMWYQAWPKDWKGEDVALVGYAESDDGVAWRKRTLGICPYGGAVSHLTNLGFHSPAVFVDPEAPASARYRATGYAHPRYAGAPPGLRTGGTAPRTPPTGSRGPSTLRLPPGPAPTSSRASIIPEDGRGSPR